MSVIFKQQTKRFSSGYDAFLGKICVGSVFYNACRQKDDPRCYRAVCLLPQTVDVIGDFEEQEMAKDALIACVNGWLEKALK